MPVDAELNILVRPFLGGALPLDYTETRLIRAGQSEIFSFLYSPASVGSGTIYAYVRPAVDLSKTLTAASLNFTVVSAPAPITGLTVYLQLAGIYRPDWPYWNPLWWDCALGEWRYPDLPYPSIRWDIADRVGVSNVSDKGAFGFYLRSATDLPSYFFGPFGMCATGPLIIRNGSIVLYDDSTGDVTIY